MKSSRIVLYSGAGFLALLILASLIVMKMSISRDLGTGDGEEIVYSGETLTREIDTRGIDSVHLIGGWKAGLSRGASGAGTVTIPAEALERLELEQRGDTLYVALRKKFSPGPDSPYKIELELESLRSVRIEGAADMELRGFDEQELELRVDGAANIGARDLRVANLTVRAAGASNLELEGALVVNADLSLEGASNAVLQMNGGRLTGRVAGVGSVEYGGEVSEETIRTEGIASVRRR